MFFKKIRGKIFGVQLNEKEQAALDAEIRKQVRANSRLYEIETDCSILWMLHTEFGFGPKRLRKAWALFYEQAGLLAQHYEMPTSDGAWICQQRLKDIGCDVEEWYKEMDEEAKKK